MKPESGKTWDPGDFAYWGALAGMTLAFVLKPYRVFGGRFDDIDPLIYIVVEMVLFACGGAMLSATIAGMRNRAGRKKMKQR